MELNNQDEDFLYAIRDLSEEDKNIIIDYMSDKCEAIKENNKAQLKEILEIINNPDLTAGQTYDKLKSKTKEMMKN